MAQKTSRQIITHQMYEHKNKNQAPKIIQDRELEEAKKKKKAQTSITNCLQLEDPIALWSRHRECARHRMSMVSYSKRCIVPWALLYWFSNGINDCLILTGFLHGLAKKL